MTDTALSLADLDKAMRLLESLGPISKDNTVWCSPQVYDLLLEHASLSREATSVQRLASFGLEIDVDLPPYSFQVGHYEITREEDERGPFFVAHRHVSYSGTAQGGSNDRPL